ncbi:hypothetical protein WKV44_00445 [Spirochaetia bacterium 38H-sp]|uniref:DUF4397 domain-containing protein n=1 Tax=Rarispira pelagica TaxID=3141764 RepID=A0ABU9U8L3_9SPIR
MRYLHVKIIIYSIVTAILISSCDIASITGEDSTDNPPTIESFSDNGDGTARVSATDDKSISTVFINSTDITAHNTGSSTSYISDIPLSEGDNTLVVTDSAGQTATAHINIDLNIAVGLSLSATQAEHNHDSNTEVTATIDPQKLSYSYGKFFIDGTEKDTFTGKSFGINVDWVGNRQISVILYDDKDNILGASTLSQTLEGTNTPPEAPVATGGTFSVMWGYTAEYTVIKSDINNDTLTLETDIPASFTDMGSYWDVVIDTTAYPYPYSIIIMHRAYDGHSYSSQVPVNIEITDPNT